MCLSPSDLKPATPSPPLPNNELTSAGVLLLTRLEGSRWCALLYNATGGPKAKCLTDFGGKKEYVIPCGCLAPPPPPSGRRPDSHTRESPDACAARELFEESAALWGLGEFLQPPIKPKPRAAAPRYQSFSAKSKKKRNQIPRLTEENNAIADDLNHASVYHGADDSNTSDALHLFSACEELGAMERDRYKCSIRHVPVLPSSLFCNLRGEEGAGAQRNRRFVLLDISAIRFSAPVHNARSARQNTRLAVYPPLHIRLHAVKRPPAFEYLLEGKREKEDKRQAEENCGGGNVVPEDQTRFAGGILEEKNISEEELNNAVKALSLSPSAVHTAQSARDSHRPFSLETLLPTKHQVLSHPTFLRQYLRNHTSGLLKRCRASSDEEKENDFAGSSEAAAALMQSALWRHSKRIALVGCPAAAFLREAAEAEGTSEKKTFVEIGKEEVVTTEETTGHDSASSGSRREAVDLVVMGAACVSPYGFLVESDEEVAAKLKAFLCSTGGYSGRAIPLAVVAHDLQVMEDLMPACTIPSTPSLSRGTQGQIDEKPLPLPPLLAQFSRIALEVNRLVAQSSAVEGLYAELKNVGDLRLICTPTRTLLCDPLFPTVTQQRLTKKKQRGKMRSSRSSGGMMHKSSTC